MVIDFSSKTSLRQFELVIEGRSVYINHYYLSEISPYFYALCFSKNFEESKQKRAKLDDISYGDVLELLKSVCPGEDFDIGPRINSDNFALLIHLSNRLLFIHLRQQLHEILKGDLLIFQMAPCSSLLEILYEAMIAQFSDKALLSLCKKIVRFEECEINRLVKKFPEPFNQLMQNQIETAKQEFSKISIPRSSYNWNQFHTRLFF